MPAGARSLMAASKYYRVDMQGGRGGGRGSGGRYSLLPCDMPYIQTMACSVDMQGG